MEYSINGGRTAKLPSGKSKSKVFHNFQCKENGSKI